MTIENEKKMWGNLLMLLFGNPSKETIDGLSDIINGDYDIETSIDMIDDLIKNDKSLSPLRHTKEDVEIGYKTGGQEAIKQVLEIIDKWIDFAIKWNNAGFEGNGFTIALRALKYEINALKGE